MCFVISICFYGFFFAIFDAFVVVLRKWFCYVHFLIYAAGFSVVRNLASAADADKYAADSFSDFLILMLFIMFIYFFYCLFFRFIFLFWCFCCVLEVVVFMCFLILFLFFFVYVNNCAVS